VPFYHSQAAGIAGQRARKTGSSIKETGITASSPAAPSSPLNSRAFAVEELLQGVYMTPTYGNTLMGLALLEPISADDGTRFTYYAAPAAPPSFSRGISTILTSSVDYGQTGRVMLTTLTKEFLMPRFQVRDEGEREPPYAKFPVGRRQRRPPLPRLRRHNDRGVY